MQTSLGYNMYLSHHMWDSRENRIQLASLMPYAHFKTQNWPTINGTVAVKEVATKLITCLVRSWTV